MPKREKDPIGFFKIAKVTLSSIMAVAPGYYIAQQGLAVIHGLFWGVGVLVTQWFFDAVAKAAEGTAGISRALWMFALFAFIGIAQQVLNGIHNFTHDVLYAQLKGYTRHIIHDKTARITPIAFEDPRYLDDINKAEKGADNLYIFQVVFVGLFTFYLPYFIFMAFYLFSVSPILALAVLLAFVPCMVSQLVNARIMEKLEDKSAPIRREFDFYEQAVCDKAFMKETRLLGAFAYFRRLYWGALLHLNKEVFSAKRTSNLVALALNILSLLAYGFVIIMLIQLLLKGEITPGSFAAVFYSMSTVFGIMEEIVVRHLGSVSKEYGSIRNYIRFLELPEISGAHAKPDHREGICLSGVSFRYPKSDKDSLSDVSLQIADKETIAIVGVNGSGKTTLVKLLTGIYMPTSGVVTVGGRDTISTHPRSIYETMTGVFQKYQRYALSLRENVEIAGGVGAVEDVMSKSGVDYADSDTFPDGLSTVLSREFDGVDLSGGQWQRLAIARGYYKPHDVIVLDEPTAAIDPIEESRIYRQFAEIAKDKTAVIVTHRMGSARIADRIVVMDAGRIVQIGTHDELISADGLYRRMYEAQAAWYRDDAALAYTQAQ